MSYHLIAVREHILSIAKDMALEPKDLDSDLGPGHGRRIREVYQFS